MVRQFSAAFLALVVVGLAACQSTPATPQMALSSSLNPQTKATEGYGSCPSYGDWINIGEYRGPTKDATTIVVDGETVGSGPLQITCSVIPKGNAFDVDVQALISSNDGGSVHITGSFTASGDQNNVKAVFQKADYEGQFTATDCSVTYYGPNEDTTQPSFRGVAAGRVWGFLTCESATNPTSQKACRAVSQFRFENCAKE